MDPILIFIFDMGISGAAWATIIARGASALSDLISSLIAIVSLKSAFNHLNKLENEYRLEETEALSFVAE